MMIFYKCWGMGWSIDTNKVRDSGRIRGLAAMPGRHCMSINEIHFNGFDIIDVIILTIARR